MNSGSKLPYERPALKELPFKGAFTIGTYSHTPEPYLFRVHPKHTGDSPRKR